MIPTLLVNPANEDDDVEVRLICVLSLNSTVIGPPVGFPALFDRKKFPPTAVGSVPENVKMIPVAFSFVLSQTSKPDPVL